MKQAVIFLALLIVGCGPLTRVSSEARNDDAMLNERPPADELFRALGNSVEAGTVQTLSDLSRLILALARNGNFSKEDMVAFDAAFPNAPTDQRQLTSADAKSLRSIKAVKQTKR